jgi:hypothetical protein
MGEMRSARIILVRRPEGKRHFGSPKFRWEDSIKWIVNKYGERMRTASG